MDGVSDSAAAADWEPDPASPDHPVPVGAQPDPPSVRRRLSRGLRLLGWVWMGLIGSVMAGAGAVQWLGPPHHASPGPAEVEPVGGVAQFLPILEKPQNMAETDPAGAVAPEVQPRPVTSQEPPAPAPVPDVAVATAPLAVLDPPKPVRSSPSPSAAVLPPVAEVKLVPVQDVPVRDVPGPDGHPVTQEGGAIRPPEPALQEPAPDLPGTTIPRIGPDGRSPLQAYAAGVRPPDARPRIAFLIAGIGLSGPETTAAITSTPAPVSLAFSPYAVASDKMLEQVRAAGHEMLISLPMEPQGFPMNDAGNRALLTGNAPALNQQRLIWTLARFAGYVGATNALGSGLLGERFAGSDEQMAMVLEQLAARGLLYVDARPPETRSSTARAAHDVSHAMGRSADVVIDEPAGRADVEAKLAALEQQARDQGSALGVTTAPLPVTVDRVAAWARTVAMRGFVLVPVSALALPPRPSGTASR